MLRTVLELRDRSRDRVLVTHVYVPPGGSACPLIVFGHGAWGSPRKFTRLFLSWVDAGYAVAAPTFPHTNDQADPHLIEDVVHQPGDISFVIDEILGRGIGDAGRVAVGGFSLGAETGLAVALHPQFADERLCAVVAIGGALFHPAFSAMSLRRLPLLLVHGGEDSKNDRLIEALRLYEIAEQPKELLLLEGAGHGVCQDDDPTPHVLRVATATTSFWKRYV